MTRRIVRINYLGATQWIKEKEKYHHYLNKIHIFLNCGHSYFLNPDDNPPRLDWNEDAYCPHCK